MDIGRRGALACCMLLIGGFSGLFAQYDNALTHPVVSAEGVRNMECRYFIELLTVHSTAGLRRQLDPLQNTDINTVVCCPIGWRFYNFSSAVDLTWKEPDNVTRDVSRFPVWKQRPRIEQDAGSCDNGTKQAEPIDRN